MNKTTDKKSFSPKHPLLLFGYAALCLALSLTGQYLCENAAFDALAREQRYALSGLGQLSFFLFGIFMYRIDISPLRAQKRSALLYFSRFAAALGFLVTVGESRFQMLLWSAVLLFCLALLMQNAFSRGEKTCLLCLPAAVTVIAAAIVTIRS